MLQANRARYNSDNWHSSAERAALVEAGQSQREQSAEVRAEFAAVRGQHQPKSSPWSEEHIFGRQAFPAVVELLATDPASLHSRDRKHQQKVLRIRDLMADGSQPILPRGLKDIIHKRCALHVIDSGQEQVEAEI
ncbi:hypothetical protein LIA77_08766 [Sarocladium implicatum]|nr:hypothetical protein LIA77_08766 [Sarocladium implicatum]